MSATLARASVAMSSTHAATTTSKQQVLSLYRALLRTARALPSYNHRGHVLQQAKASFRANAHLPAQSEEVTFAVQLGETQLENLQAQVSHMRDIMHRTNTLTHSAPKPERMYQQPTLETTPKRAFHSTRASRAVGEPLPSAASGPFGAPLSSLLPSQGQAAATPSAFWSAGGAGNTTNVPTAIPAAAANATQPISPNALFPPTTMPGGDLDPNVTAVPAALVATHIVHVRLTSNNTILTLTNLQGATKAWSSSGTAGFKNAKKSTYMACIAAGEQLGLKARNQGVKAIDMHIAGFHKNKKAVLKGLMKAGLNIVAIRDTTPIPFNGCKPKKQRRL